MKPSIDKKGKVLEQLWFKITYWSFLVFIIFPIIYTIGKSLLGNESFLENIAQFNFKTFQLLGKSIGLAFLVGILSTSIGLILGFLLYKSNQKWVSFFKLIILIPLFISPYILAVAWKDSFSIFFHSSNLLTSFVGVVLVLTTIFTPLSMLIIGSALSNIDKHIEEAGLMITNYKDVLFRIIIPLIKPAILTSFILVFIFSISDFSVAGFFGIQVFTTEIFIQFSAFYNHSFAIFQSLFLIIICVVLLYFERNYIADAPFFSIGTKGIQHKLYDLGKWKTTAFFLLFLWISISIFLPITILIFQSFRDGITHFIQAFELLRPTFLSSIFLSFVGSILIVFIGFTAAFFNTRKYDNKGSKTFDWLLLLVFAIPSTILGISLIQFYNQPFLDVIYSSYAIIIIGYLGKFSFISSKLIQNSIKQIPHSLFEAASITGISFSKQIWKILIPLIFPTLLIAFIISFIFCLGELGITIMLYPPGTEIMPIKVYTIMANAPQALTSSMTLIVFSITLSLIGLFYLIFNKIVSIKVM